MSRVRADSKTLLYGITYGVAAYGLTGSESMEYLHIGEAVKNHLAWALRKDSELREVINYHLRTLKESGVMDFLVKVRLRKLFKLVKF